MYSNLRAAKQLENIGKYSGAISCLEEFLTENSNYENADNINLKIKSLQEKQRIQGDSSIELSFKPLLTIPKSILTFIFETFFEWAITLVILAAIYYALKIFW